jgi:hypothetical protein
MSSGATPAQATLLATNLGIDPGALVMANGQVSFIDPTNFIAVPTLPVPDPIVVSNLVAGTVNKYPAIALSVRQLDLVTLGNLTAMNPGDASNKTTTAMSNAGVTPQFGTPLAANTALTLNYTNTSGVVVSNTYLLDTAVSYQFVEPSNGIPLVGPGAQVQVSYQPNTYGTTHLLYACRQLQAGPPVDIMSASDASNRVATLYYPGLNATITPQLVYYCPPLSASNCSLIIPHYQCTATVVVTNPNLTVFTMNLFPVMFPATTNPAVVPSATLTASTNSSGQVIASVSASGGTPPYTYTWGGSDPNASTNTGSSIAYTPMARFEQPTIVPIRESPTTFQLSWEDDTGAFILQSATSLVLGDWAQDTNSVVISNGVSTVSLDIRESPTKFFRLYLATLPATENVTVLVTDANGLSAQANQPVSVRAWRLWPRKSQGICYGCESPFDPCFLLTGDRQEWQAGMGQPGAGGGEELFCWIDGMAWPGDFIEPQTPGQPNNFPEIYGDADICGVNTADMVFYAGHGGPGNISFTWPCFTSSNKSCSVLEVGIGGYPTISMFQSDCSGTQVGINVSSYAGSWRSGPQWPNDTLEWLCLLSCYVLGDVYPGAWHHWGGKFNGLHIMTGFRTEAQSATGFPGAFANNLLGVGVSSPLNVVQAWFGAATDHGTGGPAAMGPMIVSPEQSYSRQTQMYLISNIGDFYWGKGPVGPNIYPPFQGYWYLAQ